MKVILDFAMGFIMLTNVSVSDLEREYAFECEPPKKAYEYIVNVETEHNGEVEITFGNISSLYRFIKENN